ncbi:hypothetical protein [Pajaroellobacter abortibovis]|uniref:Uncharacterized protein n=1 Tax=Pajaroellobacter abortibovis TaxID=1882918 RepID=A0A1L6MUQ3_9BACT|nr:hypothetical protein [Pajaroellobacter abortibovis]APR99249.1 hypothetical protein BCY86_00100 [Pajaroellobacter abortibovis]
MKPHLFLFIGQSYSYLLLCGLMLPEMSYPGGDITQVEKNQTILRCESRKRGLYINLVCAIYEKAHGHLPNAAKDFLQVLDIASKVPSTAAERINWYSA